MTELVDRLARVEPQSTEMLHWGAPVPAFGDPTTSIVATVGLNPSNREFVDASGTELSGAQRRFHTLQSLGIGSWFERDASHLESIVSSCRFYFERSPYDLWFKRLNRIIAGSGASYYAGLAPACHVDLVPYATSRKWSALSRTQRSSLIEFAADSLGLLLRSSSVAILVLNGASVVAAFQQLVGARFEATIMSQWQLCGRTVSPVAGVAFRGVIDRVAGVRLARPTLVLGFNHNIQSSFGVTRQVEQGIADWVAFESAQWR